MPCQLCDKELEIEKEVDVKEAKDITENDWFHSVAGFTVCKTCKDKVTTFFRNLVTT